MSLGPPDFFSIGLRSCHVYLSSPFSKLLQAFCRINADYTAVHSGLPQGFQDEVHTAELSPGALHLPPVITSIS